VPRVLRCPNGGEGYRVPPIANRKRAPVKDLIYREIEEFKAAPTVRKVVPLAILVIVGAIVVLQLTGVIGADPTAV